MTRADQAILAQHARDLCERLDTLNALLKRLVEAMEAGQQRKD